MTDRYAVIGNPIEHSRSPLIHTAFAQQTGDDLEYGSILGIDFKPDVTAFFSSGGSGLNITLPFKEEAWQLVDKRSDRAKTAGAVNTISILPDGRLYGDNTDGAGLINRSQQQPRLLPGGDPHPAAGCGWRLSRGTTPPA